MKRFPFLLLLLATALLSLPSCDVQRDVVPEIEIVGIDYDFIELTQVNDYVWSNGTVSPIAVVMNVTIEKTHRVDIYYDNVFISTIIGTCDNRLAAYTFMEVGGIFSIVVNGEYEEGIRLQ